MLTDLRGALAERVVGLRTVVVAVVVIGLVFGAGGYLLGHDMGRGDAGGAEFRRQQQSLAQQRLVSTTSALVGIEQQTVELLTGKAGSEVDLDAFLALHTRYTAVYDDVLAERGRISALYDAPAREAAHGVTSADNAALNALFVAGPVLARLTAGEVAAQVNNSIAARKAQWAALRRFSQAALAQMTGER